MSLKSKEKAAKARAKLQQQKVLENQKLEKNAKRLQSLTGGFSFSSHKPKVLKVKQPEVIRRNYLGTLPAKPDPVYVPKSRLVLTEDQQAREQAAQAAIRAKQALVMPIFNKGGYQLPTESDLADFKSGLLRRRS